MRVGDYDVAIVLRFHALVLDAERAHQFHAADLEPDQIVRVVDDAHLVGFGVAHAYCRVVVFGRCPVNRALSASFHVASPLWFAFFEKGREPFLEIRGAADAGILENGAFQIGVDAGGSGGGQQALCARQAAGAGGNEHVSQFAGAILQTIGRHDFR